ncbi:MAG: hypothetical protein F6K22_37050 [Okeania sp. SIO2F4]|uniref:hypothetical protein n=1 Tax=Okeania sp. SIO2F4 TaxID=2607790 RepID=UPI00142CB510|nr:hypothetical protein [Okeania sp. SIO2F4]NES07908.1 hypothetical protein [Okeania sp. SIO2F4]
MSDFQVCDRDLTETILSDYLQMKDLPKVTRVTKSNFRGIDKYDLIIILLY